MSRPILSWTACGITLLGFCGIARAAYTFDALNDDFTRTADQLQNPNDKSTVAGHVGWYQGGTVYAKDSNGDNVPASIGIYSNANGFLKVDMAAQGIASGGASLLSFGDTTPQTRFYTYEVRLTVDQFGGDNGSITIANILNGWSGGPLPFDGHLNVSLRADGLDIHLYGDDVNTISDVTTEAGTAYTWRFITDQQNGTVDIYRRANDADPFVAIATNQSYYASGQSGPQISIGANYGSGDTAQPIVSFDYVRLGSNAVPEPATLGLLGMAGLGLLTKRRRHS